MTTGHRIEYRIARTRTGFAVVETISSADGTLVAVTTPLSIELETIEALRVEFDRMLRAFARDPIDLEYLECELVPPTRIEQRVLELVAARADIASAALVARIAAAFASSPEREYPGVRFDASHDPSTGLFEPIALVGAVASDVTWMRERGVEAAIGDELAFRLVPTDIELATERWPAMNLEAVVTRCERALGWVLADCVAPDWLRALPIPVA